jgi:hypothetical protein
MCSLSRHGLIVYYVIKQLYHCAHCEYIKICLYCENFTVCWLWIYKTMWILWKFYRLLIGNAGERRRVLRNVCFFWPMVGAVIISSLCHVVLISFILIFEIQVNIYVVYLYSIIQLKSMCIVILIFMKCSLSLTAYLYTKSRIPNIVMVYINVNYIFFICFCYLS